MPYDQTLGLVDQLALKESIELGKGSASVVLNRPRREPAQIKICCSRNTIG